MTSSSLYAKFGYDHQKLGKKALKAILDNNEVDYDRQATVYDLLPVVEKLFADKRVKNGTATKEYLCDGFEPSSYTAPHLRQVLSYHGIPYHTARPSKPDLEDIFIDNIEAMREDEGCEEPAPRKSSAVIVCDVLAAAAALEQFKLLHQAPSNASQVTGRSLPSENSQATGRSTRPTTRKGSFRARVGSSHARSKSETSQPSNTTPDLEERLQKNHVAQSVTEILYHSDNGNKDLAMESVSRLLADMMAEKKRD
jgi:hypothetical protein